MSLGQFISLCVRQTSVGLSWISEASMVFFVSASLKYRIASMPEQLWGALTKKEGNRPTIGVEHFTIPGNPESLRFSFSAKSATFDSKNPRKSM